MFYCLKCIFPFCPFPFPSHPPLFLVDIFYPLVFSSILFLFFNLLAPVVALRCKTVFFLGAESVTITPKDSRWVGAWWLGFLVSSSLLLVSSIPFWFLPRSLPKQGHETDKPTDPPSLIPDGAESAQNSNQTIKLTEIAKGCSRNVIRLEK